MGNEESKPTPIRVPQPYITQPPQQYNAPQGWQQFPQYQQQNTSIRQQTPMYPPQQQFQPQNTFIRQQSPQYPPSNGNPGQRVPSARISSARDRQLYPNLAIPSTNSFSAGFKLDDQTLKRFLEIQSLIDAFEKKGVFDGLRIAEEEFEAMDKSKRQAEINHKVLTEQTKKEQQDFENISQPTVQAYFKSQQAHKQAISKEEVSLSFK